MRSNQQHVSSVSRGSTSPAGAFFVTNATLVAIATLLFISACSTSQVESEPKAIGLVTLSTGSPAVLRNNRPYILDNQSRIFVGDIVQTDSSSKAHITMIDNTSVEIGTDSHIVFNHYSYTNGDASPAARITLTAGSLRTKTQFVEVARRLKFEIQTPVAVVNVLGADVWAGFKIEHNTLDVASLSGRGIVVVNEHGSVDVTIEGGGTTVIGGTAPQPPMRWSDRKLDRSRQKTRIAN